MSMKINRLEIENVKRIKAVKLEPAQNGLSESAAAFSGSTGVRCNGNARPWGYAEPWRIF